jgi:glyoxylase-like metal-dependent hydrolase (beta-lactamase superfamily II)
MIFRQLFEPVSSTYTYLLGCEQTGQAILVDTVLPTWQRDMAVINTLGLTLAYTLDTHIHADHISAARKLKQETGSRIAHPALDNLSCADIGLAHQIPFGIGSIIINPLHTPGHTDNHFAYAINDRVLTGDALLIEGCGRTDFQNGDAPTLYRSIHDQLFTLEEGTLVYPAHDYQGHHVSSIAQEKIRNPRLGNNKSLAEFVEIMDNLKLAYPKFIDYAVPGNRECGICSPDVPVALQQYCHQIRESQQG